MGLLPFWGFILEEYFCRFINSVCDYVNFNSIRCWSSGAGQTSRRKYKEHHSFIKECLLSASELASMTAPVGCSVHRMGCVFHPPLHPMLTIILPESIFFACWPQNFFLGPIFSQPWPSYYPLAWLPN